jgi:hypothetical protein
MQGKRFLAILYNQQSAKMGDIFAFRRNSKTENYLAVLCEIFCRIGDVPHV